MIARGQLSLIHVARARLAMSEQDYRALLQRVAGVASSKLLDARGFDAVMAEFTRLGFQKGPPLPQRPSGRQEAGFASAAQLHKLRAAWQSFTGRDDELALGRWLEKHFHVSHARFLRGADAGKAIAIVERMGQRKRSKQAAEASTCSGTDDAQ